MNVPTIVSATGAVLCTILAAIAFFRNGRSTVNLSFAAGMIALAVEQVFLLLSTRAPLPSEVLLWEHWRIVAMSALPGCWLLFSLGYGRENYRQFLSRWQWGIYCAFLLPTSLTCFAILTGTFFTRVGHGRASSGWILPLAQPGILFHIVFLLALVIILANMEKTLRSSFGTQRWRIKFTFLGIGSILAVRVYTTAQALLYSHVDLGLFPLDAGTLVIADLLIFVSLLRSGLRKVDIYVSQEVLYNSLTLVIAGIYLLALGIFAKAAAYFNFGEVLLHNAFWVFLLFLGLAVILLSDKLKHAIRRFVHRHFRRPLHDYRKIWRIFTQRTSSLFEIRDLCDAIAKTVSETFGVSSVCIWLVDQHQERPSLGGSTAISPVQRDELKELEREIGVLLVTMREKLMPLDLHRPEWENGSDDGTPGPPNSQHPMIRYCAPLSAGGEFLGFMTLNRRIADEPFTPEDFDLLKTIADQAAGILLNHRLYESLGRAREMEAFQTLSTFFVHDLKNIASTLSLTLENMPLHYDNPEFRSDALRIMSKNLDKIRTMCSRMSQLNHKLELDCRPCDLNKVISATLAGLEGVQDRPVVFEPGNVPEIFADREQISKVVLNLILNAFEASSNGREVRITCAREREFAMISVSDNGCGMSRQFMEKHLFHPFKTTKERGLGIGLYHCKMIVEAHRGRIEVESTEGAGTTFRVLLPVSGPGGKNGKA